MKSLTIACALLLVLPCMAWAVDCPIPDTGQTRCYDNNEQKITCPSPGEDFYGQDAQYPCNPQSYTQLDASGTPMPFSADYSTTPWAMVRDNVTGLMWEVKTDDGSTHDKDNTYTWYDGITGVPGAGTDTQDFIAALNTPPGFGGFTDWRIPTIKELSFIRNIDTYHPAINTVYFPNTAPAYYWSSTSYAYAPTYACGVYFYYGYMGSYKKSFSRYVRAVRGGQCGSFGDFIDNGNGTVTDTSTGLMWQQATVPENYTWEQALSYCETLSLADYDDWRLPAVNELQSIVDYSRYYPSIDPIFPNTMSSDYWSSTSYAKYASPAWYVYFYGGSMSYDDKSEDNYVRAVRQCGSPDTTTTTTAGTNTTTTTVSTSDTIHSGSGIVFDGGYINFGTGNISYSGATAGKTGYFYGSSGIKTLYFGDEISPSPCKSPFGALDGYQGVKAIQEFTSAVDHVFTTQHAIIFGDKYSDCYQGILLFRQNGLYGGIDPIDIDGAGSLHFNWWYDDSGNSDFSGASNPTLCTSETIYGEHSEQTELLRYFRDNVLNNSPAGQEIIKLYYQWSPAISELMEADDEFKQDVKDMIDGILEII